jgi:hypothetical protein
MTKRLETAIAKEFFTDVRAAGVEGGFVPHGRS